MDQSCELAAEADDIMDAEMKMDEDEGMVGGDLTLQCTSHRLTPEHSASQSEWTWSRAVYRKIRSWMVSGHMTLQCKGMIASSQFFFF